MRWLVRFNAPAGHRSSGQQQDSHEQTAFVSLCSHGIPPVRRRCRRTRLCGRLPGAKPLANRHERLHRDHSTGVVRWAILGRARGSCSVFVAPPTIHIRELCVFLMERTKLSYRWRLISPRSSAAITSHPGSWCDSSRRSCSAARKAQYREVASISSGSRSNSASARCQAICDPTPTAKRITRRQSSLTSLPVVPRPPHAMPQTGLQRVKEAGLTTPDGPIRAEVLWARWARRSSMPLWYGAGVRYGVADVC